MLGVRRKRIGQRPPKLQEHRRRFPSKLQLKTPSRQALPAKPPYDNMLANVSPDEVYQAVAQGILAQSLQHLPEELAKRIAGRRDVSEPVAGDTFYAIYSYHPMLKEKDQVKNEILQEFVDVFKKWMSTREFANLRNVTRLNRTASTVFALRFAKEFLQELAKRIPPEEWPPNPPPGGSPQGGGRQGQGGGRGTIDYWLDSSSRGGQQQSPEGHDKEQGQQGQQQGQGQQGQDNQQGQNQDQGGGRKPTRQEIQQAVQQAFETAKGKAKEAVETYSVLGGLTKGTTPAKLAFLDEELGIDIVEFRTIIEILGKIKKAMPIMFTQHKVRARLGMPGGYGVTRKPEKAIPRELALPEELFLAKLAKGQFLTRVKLTREKGVMILLLDRSGSMSGYKIAWAKAVALALGVKAMKEKLDYMLIPFDYGVHESMTLDQLEDIMRISAGGGTDIGDAIVASLELAILKGYKRANVIVITDGEDWIAEDYETKILDLAKKVKASIKVFYIEGTNEVLKRIARATKGQLFTVEPSGESAISVVSTA